MARPTVNYWIVGSLAAAATVSLVYWYLQEVERQKGAGKKGGTASTSGGGGGKSRSIATPRNLNTTSSSLSVPASLEGERTPLVGNRSSKQSSSNEGDSDVRKEEKALHARIEELDKKGKALFKNKQASVNF